jgi:hypothetical protein
LPEHLNGSVEESEKGWSAVRDAQRMGWPGWHIECVPGRIAHTATVHHFALEHQRQLAIAMAMKRERGAALHANETSSKRSEPRPGTKVEKPEDGGDSSGPWIGPIDAEEKPSSMRLREGEVFRELRYEREVTSRTLDFCHETRAQGYRGTNRLEPGGQQRERFDDSPLGMGQRTHHSTPSPADQKALEHVKTPREPGLHRADGNAYARADLASRQASKIREFENLSNVVIDARERLAHRHTVEWLASVLIVRCRLRRVLHELFHRSGSGSLDPA